MQDQPLSFRAVPHLADAMRLRNIQPDQVLVTLRDPDLVVAARRGRIEYRKRYYDAILGKDMVLRVIADPGDGADRGHSDQNIQVAAVSARGTHLKVIYDETNDILYIRLRETPVAETDEVRPGLFADVDNEGRVVGFEILDAKETVAEPALIDLQKLSA